MEIKRGDIVLTNLEGAKFNEQGKNRVCVVIQNDIGNRFSPTTIIAPLTSELKKTNQPTHTIVYMEDAVGLSENSMVLCEQVRTIDKRRIIKKVGNVTNSNTMKNVLCAYIANICRLEEMEELLDGAY